MLTPSQKGGIAEMAIAAEAVKLGIPVLRPVTEGGRYDLAFDLGSGIVRVQCKWAVRRGEVVVVYTQTNRRTRDGFLRTTYAEDETDYIAAYCRSLDRCFVLPIALVAGRTAISLRIAAPRNGQRAGLHFADEYWLGGRGPLRDRRVGPEGVPVSGPLPRTHDRPRGAR